MPIFVMPLIMMVFFSLVFSIVFYRDVKASKKRMDAIKNGEIPEELINNPFKSLIENFEEIKHGPSSICE